MDPFLQLPVELICQILEDTADFVGVESLTSVSRPARAVLQANSPAIMQAISASHPIASQPEIKSLVSNIVILHSPSIHCATLDGFKQLAAEVHELDSPQRFHSPQVACRILHIAAQIQRLACVCLAKLQREFSCAVEASPLHAQQANRPFSCIEEYRVCWALWHLRCYSDLRKSVDNRFSPFYNAGNSSIHSKWSWPNESIQALDLYPNSDTFNPFMKEIIWTVAVALEDLKACPPSVFPGEKLQPEHRSTLSWELSAETPIPFFSSFELPRLVETQYSIWSPPPVPTRNSATNRWCLLPHYWATSSGHIGLFRFLRSQVLRSGPNWRGMNNILRYRRCGTIIWDRWRMFSTGLFPNNFRERVPTPDGGFAEAGQVETPDGPWVELDECENTLSRVTQRWIEIGGTK